jgi:hypothetical protein
MSERSTVLVIRAETVLPRAKAPNPSIERTASGALRAPTAAAHVER